MQFTVHRAASVYTPRGIVVVNPPSQERVKELASAGGATRALSWVLEGCATRSFSDLPMTAEGLKETLIAQGLSAELAETLALQAAESGGVAEGPSTLAALSPNRREAAEREAVTIALALAESRIRIEDLAAKTPETEPLGKMYREEYPRALAAAGLDSVELLDQLPLLTGNFAYTRGDAAPGQSRLVPYRARNGDYVVYADVAQTEAFFVRLDPLVVTEWLRVRGTPVPPVGDSAQARAWILENAAIPSPGDDPGPTIGTDVLTLVHTVAHRMVRQLALLAGIERHSLSELLVPSHLGFFVFAAARGDFVLGGIQAVFETELTALLQSLVFAEHRCPLDPGCSNTGGACMACLHLGEPSCRYYNRFLDRGAMWGENGYLTGLIRPPERVLHGG